LYETITTSTPGRSVAWPGVAGVVSPVRAATDALSRPAVAAKARGRAPERVIEEPQAPPMKPEVIRRHGHRQVAARRLSPPTLAPVVFGLIALLALLAPSGRAASGSDDREGPTSPGPIVVKGATQDSVTIAWAPAVDNVAVTRYGILWNTKRAADAEWTVLPTFTKTGLRCGTSYTVSVTAFDAPMNHPADPSVATVSTGSCVDTKPPSAPTGVTQVARTSTSATLSWNASSDDVGVAGYSVSRAGVPIGTTSGTSFTVTGLTCASVYDVVLQSYDPAGNRSAPTGFSGTTASCSDAVAPTAPAGLAQVSRTETTMALSWSKSTDASGVTGYGVHVDGTKVAEVSQTSTTVSSLACGKTYTIAVDAVDAAGNRSAKATASMPTANCPSPGGSGDVVAPSAPTQLRVTAMSLQSVSLAWKASSDNVGVVGYSVYAGGTVVGDTPGTRFLAPSVPCGTVMPMAVEARDAVGNRSPRTTVAVTTHPCEASPSGPPASPGAVNLQTATETSLTVSWAPSTGASGYGMYVNGVRVTTVPSGPYTFTGLGCGKAYTVGVDAVNAAGARSTVSSTMLTTSVCSDTVAPTKPAALVASNVAATTLTLSWAASTDAVGVKGYDVYVGSTVAASTKTPTVALGGLSCGTQLALGVEAFDASGNRSQRSTLSVKTASCGPTATGDLYVRSNGSDAGSCTSSAPCGSLERAYDLASPGQRIVVAAGSYPGQSLSYDSGKSSSSARVTISAGGATFASLTVDGAQHVSLEGATVNGTLLLRPETQSRIVAGSKPVSDVEISGATLQAFLFRNVADVTLRDSSVGGYDVSTSGLGVPKIGAYLPDEAGADPLTSTGVVIERVRFHDILRTQSGTTHAECLYLDGGIDGLVVRQSTFTNCGVFDVFGQPNGGDNANITLENNVFDVPRDTAGGAAGSALNFKDGSGVYRNLSIRFNSIVGNIRSDSGAFSGVSVAGNAIANSSCAATFPASAYDRNVAKTACGGTDVQADPQFMSSSTASCSLSSCFVNDLRLRSGSPAIDRLSSGPSTDNDGSARPLGNGFDAGAHETA
jgi:chitodextrinase